MSRFHPDGNSVPNTYLSWERWRCIQDCKRSFFEDPFSFSVSCPYVEPFVVESWKRCWEMELDPRIDVYANRLEDEAFRQVLAKHEDLLSVCRPLFSEFEQSAHNFHVSLIDSDGIVLLQIGRFSTPVRLEIVGASGLNWSESIVGTSSHALAVRHKRPVQLLGSEYYCNAFEPILCSSAFPIFDTANQVEAVLTMVFRQDKAALVGSEFEGDLLNESMAIIAALARAITSQLQLLRSNRSLTRLNAAYNNLNQKLKQSLAIQTVTMSGIDRSIITVDKAGMLVQCNPTAIRFLHIDETRLSDYDLRDFFPPGSSVFSLIRQQKKDQVEDTLLIDGSRHPCVIDIWPLDSSNSPENDFGGSAVLQIQNAESYIRSISQNTGNLAKYRFSDIIGKSSAIRQAIDMAKRFAMSPENILLTGQSGTGKEIFAQSIHNYSTPSGPFIALNCASMPRSLIESELFGYESGSFTGADKKGRPGKIELANGGTLFLDEIGDMPYEIQAVLLRVLQDKKVIRIGGSQYKSVHFRVIAATNRDLAAMVKDGLFREDLFFRLSVLFIHLPPLCERDGDAELFADSFIRNYCARMNWPISTLTPEARAFIRGYQWPGNLRQLENALIYAINACRDKDIEPYHLQKGDLSRPDDMASSDSSIPASSMDEALPLVEYERRAIMAALQHTENHIPRAAEILKVSKSTLYRKMREYGIDI